MRWVRLEKRGARRARARGRGGGGGGDGGGRTGWAMQTGQMWVLGSEPYSLAQLQKALVAVASWTCVSIPIVASNCTDMHEFQFCMRKAQSRHLGLNM